MENLPLTSNSIYVNDTQLRQTASSVAPYIEVKVDQEEMDGENMDKSNWDSALGAPKKKGKGKGKGKKKGKKGKKKKGKNKKGKNKNSGGGDGSDGKVPKDWKEHCKKDKAWCKKFISNMQKAGKINKLFPGGKTPKIPSDEEKRMKKKCKGKPPSCMKKARSRFMSRAVKEEVDGNDMKGLKLYAIIAGIIVVLLLCCIIYCCCCKKSSKGSGGGGGRSSKSRSGARSRKSTRRSKKGSRKSRRGGRDIAVFVRSRKSKSTKSKKSRSGSRRG